MMALLFCLDEVQPGESSTTDEEQSAPGPDATKEVDPNHTADRTEEAELAKESEALALNPDSPLESETSLAAVDLQKIQDSEE